MAFSQRAAAIAFVVVLAMVASGTPGFANSREPATEDGTIASVEVLLDLVGTEVFDKVEARIEITMKAVAEKALLGQKVDHAVRARDDFERALFQVLDRVLSGFRVESLIIDPGEVTHVGLVVAPLGDTIEQAALEIQVKGVSASLEDMVVQDAGKAGDEVAKILVGLPVDSYGWAKVVVLPAVEAVMESAAVGFQAEVRVVPGREARVTVVLEPRVPVAGSIIIDMKSRSLPNLLLRAMIDRISGEAAVLKGLPVAFLKAHKGTIEDMVSRSAQSISGLDGYGVSVKAEIKPGEETFIILNAESELYRLAVDARVNIGVDAPNPEVSLHVGRMISRETEVFLEGVLTINRLKWDWALGVGHQFDPLLSGGFIFNFNNIRGWISRRLDSDFTLRVEEDFSTGVPGVAVSYKMGDHFVAELMTDSKGNFWLRVIGGI